MRSSADFAARAQVALGTLVEVALPRSEANSARFEAAFASIAHVHRCMSAHDPDSDLGRLARGAHRGGVRVDPHTFAVLELALAIGAALDGVFDVTIAPELVRARRLPPHARGAATRCGRMHAIALEEGCRVRATEPVALDLGGIAKGYAVDCAIEALRAAGASAGVVNAGGDLRVFGEAHWHGIRVRDPRQPSIALPLCELHEHAFATSAAYFAAGIVDPRTRQLHGEEYSVSVAAPSCAIADALTKIVALAPAEAPRVLERYCAQAFVLAARGTAIATRTAGEIAASRLRMAA